MKNYGDWDIYAYKAISHKFLTGGWFIGRDNDDEAYYKETDLTLGVRTRHFTSETTTEFRPYRSLIGWKHPPLYRITVVLGIFYIRIRIRKYFLDLAIW